MNGPATLAAGGHAVVLAAPLVLFTLSTSEPDSRRLLLAFLLSVPVAIADALYLAAFRRSRRAWIPVLGYGAAAVLVWWPSVRWYRWKDWRRYSASSSSAVGHLKGLIVAEEQYRATAGRGRYGTLAALSATDPPLVDGWLGQGKKWGYTFAVTVGTPADSNYCVTAEPVVWMKTGERRFFVDSSAVVRQSTRKTGHASSADSPIE